MQDKIIEKIRNCHNVAILGFGKEGKSTYHFIRKYDKNIKLTILDKTEITLDDSNVRYKAYHGEEDLLEFDLIIKSPGVPIVGFSEETINKISSQIELLLEFNRKNVIGITGTKGKSTTSTLIYNMFKDQNKKVFLVGNIGNPVLDDLDKFHDAIIVAEISSHQLETVDYSPHVGVILNLFVDHLDHTGSVSKYHQAKMHMIKYQDEDDYAIIDIDNKYLQEQDYHDVKSKILGVSFLDMANICLDKDDIYLNNKLLINRNKLVTNLKGDHNLKNIMFAILVASLYQLDMGKVFETIKNFKPLEHRMELVGKYKDIIFYDDAIATIPESTINACKTLKDVDTLIFGGLNRNVDYQELINYLNNSNIGHFICMPTTAHMIAKDLDKNRVIMVNTLEEAVNKAFEVTKKNSICLLSPAAASYEYFKNFEEKGNKFKDLVRNYE